MALSRLEVLESVPSTMEVTRRRVQAGEVTFANFLPTPYSGALAREQTAGRGQRGRVWSSRRGASLCATFYFRHGLDLPAQFGAVSLLAGVALAEMLTAQFPASSADIGLKWPNDLLLNGKKAGGILIETAQTPQGETVALVGIGINVGEGAFPPELAHTATTLASAGIPAVDVVWLGEQIAASLAAQAECFRQQGLPDLLTRWRSFDRTPGRRFETEYGETTIIGVAAGIDDTGQLLLRLSGGSLLAVRTASSLRETIS